MLNWIRKESPRWQRSVFADLPILRQGSSRSLQNWLVLAGGLALILSRATQDELKHRFPCSQYLYEELRGKLRTPRSLLSVGPDVVGEALHEIAGVADPMTSAAARACFDACLAAEKRFPGEAKDVGSQSQLKGESSAISRAPATSEAKEDVGSARVTLEVLMERSEKLRSAVAFARTTTFGDPEREVASSSHAGRPGQGKRSLSSH